ncbi:MAG: hypothetical protein KDB14_11295, partial [Planctomycetales bacterium]|nr:hypothetical protein [Planctomycetales bacterium]
MADVDLDRLLDQLRPGHDDLHDPLLAELAPLAEQLREDRELQELARRSEQLDGSIRHMLNEAPVPAGLAERLERQLGLAPQSLDSSAISEQPSSDDLGEQDTLVTPRDRGQQRRAFWAAALVGCAAAIATMIWLAGPSPSLTPNELASQADQWAQQWSSAEFAWQTGAAPAERPLSPHVKFPVDAAWRTASLAGDEQAVVYRRQGAELLVLQADIQPLNPMPPWAPQFRTGSRRIGVWGGNGLVYVLVVQGDEQRYRALLQ